MEYLRTELAVRETGSEPLIKVSFVANPENNDLLQQTKAELERLEPSFVAADLEGEDQAFWYANQRPWWAADITLDEFGRRLYEVIRDVMGSIAYNNRQQ